MVLNHQTITQNISGEFSNHPLLLLFNNIIGWKYAEGTSLTEVEEINGKSIYPNIENPPKVENSFILLLINARRVMVFMMSYSVQLFILCIIVLQMMIILKLKMNS